jgi:hypothetical protein
LKLLAARAASVAKKSKQMAALPQMLDMALSAAPKPPTDKQRIKSTARDAKVSATQDWLRGHIDSKEHKAIHDRADHVLSGKKPDKFKGKTGEKKEKSPW